MNKLLIVLALLILNSCTIGAFLADAEEAEEIYQAYEKIEGEK